MRKIPLDFPSSSDIISLNKFICDEGGNPHLVLSLDRIEGAVHSAFLPGVAPFAYGGVAAIAGALCFFLIKGHAFQDGNKRTATLTALSFMNENGWELVYPVNESEDIDALADLVESVAAGGATKEQMIDWFDLHKRLLED